FKCAADDVEKLLAFVSVRFTAATTGLDAEEMRFHHFVAPRQKLHANTLCGFQDAALTGRDEAGIFLGIVKKRKQICPVKASDAGQCGDGGAHLPAFERTEEADRHAGGFRDL